MIFFRHQFLYKPLLVCRAIKHTMGKRHTHCYFVEEWRTVTHVTEKMGATRSMFWTTVSKNTVVIDSLFGCLMRNISGTKMDEWSEQFGLHSNEFSDAQKSPCFSVKLMGLSCAMHVARMKRKVIHIGFWGKTVHKLSTYSQCVPDTFKYYNKEAIKQETNYTITMLLFVTKLVIILTNQLMKKEYSLQPISDRLPGI